MFFHPGSAKVAQNDKTKLASQKDAIPLLSDKDALAHGKPDESKWLFETKEQKTGGCTNRAPMSADIIELQCIEPSDAIVSPSNSNSPPLQPSEVEPRPHLLVSTQPSTATILPPPSSQMQPPELLRAEPGREIEASADLLDLSSTCSSPLSSLLSSLLSDFTSEDEASDDAETPNKSKSAHRRHEWITTLRQTFKAVPTDCPAQYPNIGTQYQSLEEFKTACLVASWPRGHHMVGIFATHFTYHSSPQTTFNRSSLTQSAAMVLHP